MLKDTKAQWFKDAKYGLFIHWGLYAILAGEYQGKETRNIAEWIMNHMDIPVAEYEKLASQFDPKAFNADAVVKKAKEWGMKYVVFTAKHHEGFAMYHSECNPYNIVDATPCKRDIVSELKKACDKYDLKLGLYYSQAQDWDDPNGLSAGHDNSQKDFDIYLDNKCIPQLKELLTTYGDISMIWFDTPLTMTEQQSNRLVQVVRELQPDCLVSGRIGNNLGDYLSTNDNFIPLLPYDGDWEVPATLNETWGFKKSDHDWKSPEEILNLLLKINGRGGNYLLNVGPDANGNIPQASIDILDTVAKYVNANAESIYGTHALGFYPYELSWALFTTKEHRLFIHIIKEMKRFYLLSIAANIVKAYILETKEEVRFVQKKTSENENFWEFFPPAKYYGTKRFVICVETAEKQVAFESLPHWEFHF
ncbi:alpha-L-fucosidase [uncultured Sphaerochaeta sp.]|uniref:alpha-L-fucosidase n=1 Tax=uncultured Sphaerochaeta sp. TaxID=886478 RepID=UPI002A0A7004|nr:alpha-L-fucosidase [uncultured Sphaerochaeta sp.]